MKMINNLHTGKSDCFVFISTSGLLPEAVMWCYKYVGGSTKLGVAREGHCALIDILSNFLQFLSDSLALMEFKFS
jgi:hypothetical protein